jgi:periplasmic divalent cation tolerance protein
MNPPPCQIVLTTCPDQACAERIAKVLVEEGLAACVNILPPMRSVYKWQGKIESESEQLLLIKSTNQAFPAIRARILELHPYELPEIVAVPIADGLDRYLNWLQDPNRTP